MTSPTYDPTSRPVDPGVEQADPRLDETMPGNFADSEMEYPRTERAASGTTSRSPLAPRETPPSRPPRARRPMSRTPPPMPPRA